MMKLLIDVYSIQQTWEPGHKATHNVLHLGVEGVEFTLPIDDDLAAAIMRRAATELKPKPAPAVDMHRAQVIPPSVAAAAREAAAASEEIYPSFMGADEIEQEEALEDEEPVPATMPPSQSKLDALRQHAKAPPRTEVREDDDPFSPG